jgi:Bacitracin resistance protein BacA
MRILAGLGRSFRGRGIEPDDRDAHLGWLLVIGTIPAGLLGLTFEHPLRSVFANPIAASIFLVGNGLMLLAAEHWRRSAPVRHDSRFSDERLATELDTGKAVGIGVAQAIALLPGFSRSGAAMAGGLRAGRSNEDAARFPFLLATPLIGLAALYKLPDLLGLAGCRRPRARAGRRAVRGRHRVPVRALPRALLREEPTDAVRVLLPRRRHDLHVHHRRDLMRVVLVDDALWRVTAAHFDVFVLDVMMPATTDSPHAAGCAMTASGLGCCCSPPATRSRIASPV